MKTKICLAGATGWVGRVLTKAIVESDKLEMAAALGKRFVGKNLGDLVGIPNLELPISGSIEEALQTPCNALIDYTHPSAVKEHVTAAIQHGLAVIIGTSGLSERDFDEIDFLARTHNVGVFAAGNFALTAFLLQRFAVEAAKYVPNWEIVDYATAEKPDAPSATARELAAKVAAVGKPAVHYPIEKTLGMKEARGANVEGTQIHSLRLPGYVFGFEITFGLPGERLLLKHEAGNSAEPYVAGTLLALQKVTTFVGLRRGLDSVI